LSRLGRLEALRQEGAWKSSERIETNREQLLVFFRNGGYDHGSSLTLSKSKASNPTSLGAARLARRWRGAGRKIHATL
jgi:hypothetical protein